METEKKPQEKQIKSEDRLVRILSKDIEGKMTVYAGLTKIKGISWAFSNILCKKLGIEKNRKIGNLTDTEIDKLTNFVKDPEVPSYLKNRRKDFETNKDEHLIASNLDLKKELDIKRLKKIKSYRGIRHLLGQPTRGQRTKSHFRTNKSKGSGIKKKDK
jgi:small subunit ribosomal protein S13